ncbi:undecaprenyl-diphosphatase [Bacillus sp. AFS018417]|uniref:undecaprenyl-diphosphate phosphatase n=1 Tax=Bacillus sp. AFS018417 TaxID=2033491 RepID=UPI000BF3F701|nr:undecaprenyl-diphosphate phosphatase [Bacillus sp. AFS018417]PEZ04822.1 undecaprenyl-diphosphatase [Bacillus sp. AFS018417]
MNDITIAIILGIVEGLTEFAPVSSTGHLILVGHLLDFEGTTRATTFEVVIQLGSILAVVVVFWKRLLNIIGIGNSIKSTGAVKSHLNMLHVLIGILPFMIGGFLFHDFIKNVLFSPKTVVIGLVAGGILMIIADLLHKNRSVASDLDSVTYKQALYMGLFQCFALIPGFSRMGSTLSGGLLIGMNHKTASELSFIMAVPIMFAASGKDLFDSWSYLTANDLPLFITGFLTAFIVALIAIKFFLSLISKIKLIPFAIYRFLLAIMFWIFIL